MKVLMVGKQDCNPTTRLHTTIYRRHALLDLLHHKYLRAGHVNGVINTRNGSNAWTILSRSIPRTADRINRYYVNDAIERSQWVKPVFPYQWDYLEEKTPKDYQMQLRALERQGMERQKQASNYPTPPNPYELRNRRRSPQFQTNSVPESGEDVSEPAETPQSQELAYFQVQLAFLEQQNKNRLAWGIREDFAGVTEFPGYDRERDGIITTINESSEEGILNGYVQSIEKQTIPGSLTESSYSAADQALLDHEQDRSFERLNRHKRLLLEGLEEGSDLDTMLRTHAELKECDYRMTRVQNLYRVLQKNPSLMRAGVGNPDS